MIAEGGGVEDGGEGKDEGSHEGDFGCLRSFEGRQMDEQTDICECRVALATENYFLLDYLLI